MRIYLFKHVPPDISNALRELSKVADGATPVHWKTMTRLIFVLDTEYYRLEKKPVKTQEMICNIVYRYIIYFCGNPIAWESNSG
jgi:hypothetical protein